MQLTNEEHAVALLRGAENFIAKAIRADELGEKLYPADVFHMKQLLGQISEFIKENR